MRIKIIRDRLYFLTIGQILYLSLDIFKFVFTIVSLTAFSLFHICHMTTHVFIMGLLFYILNDDF